jgi:hypothetical protein
VELLIYNALGQRVSSILMGTQMIGTHQFNWNASELSSGVYVYQVIQRGANGMFSATGTMTLIK